MSVQTSALSNDLPVIQSGRGAAARSRLRWCLHRYDPRRTACLWHDDSLDPRDHQCLCAFRYGQDNLREDSRRLGRAQLGVIASSSRSYQLVLCQAVMANSIAVLNFCHREQRGAQTICIIASARREIVPASSDFRRVIRSFPVRPAQFRRVRRLS